MPKGAYSHAHVQPILSLTHHLIHRSLTSFFSTLTQGFEGFLGSKNAQARNKSRTFTVQDRAFSLSSYTSPAVSYFFKAFSRPPVFRHVTHFYHHHHHCLQTREMQQESERYAAEAVYGGRGKGVAAYGGVKGVGNSTVPSKRGF